MFVSNPHYWVKYVSMKNKNIVLKNYDALLLVLIHFAILINRKE